MSESRTASTARYTNRSSPRCGHACTGSEAPPPMLRRDCMTVGRRLTKSGESGYVTAADMASGRATAPEGCSLRPWRCVTAGEDTPVFQGMTPAGSSRTPTGQSVRSRSHTPTTLAAVSPTGVTEGPTVRPAPATCPCSPPPLPQPTRTCYTMALAAGRRRKGVPLPCKQLRRHIRCDSRGTRPTA